MLQNQIKAAVSILSLSFLAGCGTNERPETVVRVKQYVCSEGHLYRGEVTSCKENKVVDAGTIDFRVSLGEPTVLMRVVKQNEKNPWLGAIFTIKDCRVWDASNWECSPSNELFWESYSVINGRYVRSTGFKGEAKTTDYVGDVSIQGLALRERLRAFF